MKKRIYYIIYAILQIVFGIHGFLTAEEIATTELKGIDLSQFPESVSEIFSVQSLTTGYRILFVISTIIGFILLLMILKNKKLEKNGFTIGLLVASFLTSLDIVCLLSIITLVMVLAEKDEVVKKKKEKKKLPDIINLKTTKKDYFSGAILVIVYFAQLLFIPVIYMLTNNDMFSSIFYELIILGVTIWAFKDRYKRDLKYLKGNMKAYISNAFKYWGIMLLAVLGAGIIQIILGADGQSANQTGLEELPMLYLIPSAVIWAPIVEEAVFRGVFRRYIKNDVIFIILSGISFGLLHTFLSEEGLYNIIIYSLNYAAMGAVMAYSYTKTNNIYTSMMVHAIQNTFGVLMILVQYFI